MRIFSRKYIGKGESRVVVWHWERGEYVLPMQGRANWVTDNQRQTVVPCPLCAWRQAQPMMHTLVNSMNGGWHFQVYAFKSQCIINHIALSLLHQTPEAHRKRKPPPAWVPEKLQEQIPLPNPWWIYEWEILLCDDTEIREVFVTIPYLSLFWLIMC